MSERKAIPKSLRFEVLKRDRFACQYCGSKAPDVVLHIDHIHPVSEGGADDLLNLVTSCAGCNLGKGARLLDDQSRLEKQRARLEELQERREQIDMMLQWQTELSSLTEHVAERLADFWKSKVPGYTVNETGLQALRKISSKFSVEEVTFAIERATEQYLEFGKDGVASPASVQKTFDYIERIAKSERKLKDQPHLRELYFVRNIARQNCGYFDYRQALMLLEEAHYYKAPIVQLKRIAAECRNWSDWRSTMDEYIAELKEGSK